MTDHLLTDVRDLVSSYVGLSNFEAEFRAHNVSDSSATEIVGHLDKGWSWRSDSSPGGSTQWLSGSHEGGISVTLFLDAPPRDPDTTARGKAIIETARATYDASDES